MNERTIQLYKQAVDFAYTTAGEDAGKGTLVEGLTAGKFAQLIVRECAMIARSTKREVDVDGGAVMRKHFGVDE
jgi:hypothetical protein